MNVQANTNIFHLLVNKWDFISSNFCSFRDHFRLNTCEENREHVFSLFAEMNFFLISTWLGVKSKLTAIHIYH